MHRDLENSSPSISLRNALLSMYAKFGDLKSARAVFRAMEREGALDSASVGAMMDALCCAARHSESIALFARFYDGANANELELDVQCFVVAFRAFAMATALHFGQRIHSDLKRTHSELLKQRPLQIALINFYGKCAMLSECERIAADADADDSDLDVRIGNALIHAFGRNGQIAKCEQIFDRMLGERSTTQRPFR